LTLFSFDPVTSAGDFWLVAGYAIGSIVIVVAVILAVSHLRRPDARR